MTATSLTVQPHAQVHGVQREIATAFHPSEMGSRYWNSTRALAELKRDGLDEHISDAVRRAEAALSPADHNRLVDRLTALGMMMAPNRPPAEATIWLREMCRLLADFPEDILGDAIDGALRESRFLPTLAEIRERADPELNERRRFVSQMRAVEALVASGADVPPAPRVEWGQPELKEPVVPCTPEQAAEILKEFGLKANPLDRIEE